MWSVICKGAIGTIVLIDHSTENPLKDLEFYVSSFQEFTNNIAIGITHIDAKPERATSMYREWLDQKAFCYPLFHVDARIDDDVRLLVETLVASIEVNLEKSDSN